MATQQKTLAELDRGGSESTQTARVVLSKDRMSIQLILSAFSSDCQTMGDARDKTEKIMQRESPAEFDAAHPAVDKCIYCVDPDIGAALCAAHSLSGFEIIQVLLPSPAVLGSDCEEMVDNLDAIAALDPRKISIITGPSPSDRIDIRPGDREMTGVVSALQLADRVGLARQRAAERRDLQRWADWDMDGGRARLGFEWVDGELVPGSDYDEVCATLELVVTGEMSKRKAAAHLDTSSRTITRAIEERPARYGL